MNILFKTAHDQLFSNSVVSYFHISKAEALFTKSEMASARRGWMWPNRAGKQSLARHDRASLWVALFVL